MRAVVQRVKSAAVTIENAETRAIGAGLMVLLGVTHADTERGAAWLARKVAGLRVFEDREGKMNCTPADIGGSFLVVSNFTLYADCSAGRRPSFIAAARPEQAEPLYLAFVEALCRESGAEVKTGEFGAEMQVDIQNDGPVTLIVETPISY